MKNYQSSTLRAKLIGMALGTMAIFLVAALLGCTPKGPVEQQKTPQQIWVDAHPTHTNDKGECIEFDDEPCDDDPYDLDDWSESYHKTPAAKKTTPRPMLTANQPKPKTTRR